MDVGGDFSVAVIKKEVVAAMLPVQEHWLPLSNLDLLLPSVDVSVFFCYKKNNIINPIPVHGDGGDQDFSFGSMVGALKRGMAEALVSYYAFSGEVLTNSVGEPELLCNNRGVDFIEARADVRLDGLNFYNPDVSIEGKLVPAHKKNNRGVLSVQVTELKCGGMVVGCTFDHRIADAYSANMFFVSWAELTQCKPLSVVPSFRRSLLNPRRPGSYHPSMTDMYALISALPSPPPPPPPGGADHPPLISRIYYVTAEQLSLLQTLATSKGSCSNKIRTKLESFSAFLWKMMAETETENENKRVCKMGIVVDGRRRLSCGSGHDKLSSYFGNVLSIPYGEKTVEELKEKPLSWVGDAVHECLKEAATKEHFLGLIDWVEAHRPEPALAKIYCGGGSSDGPAFVVSSGQRFPASKVDFGWGRPALGSYHFPWGGDAGYVMPMPSLARDGDWVVYMHLFRPQIQLIENEASHIFKPLTSQYLHLLA